MDPACKYFDAVAYPALARFRWTGYGIRDTGYGIRDMGYGIWHMGYRLRLRLTTLGQVSTVLHGTPTRAGCFVSIALLTLSGLLQSCDEADPTPTVTPSVSYVFADGFETSGDDLAALFPDDISRWT